MSTSQALTRALALVRRGPMQVMVDPAGEAVELFAADGVDLRAWTELEPVRLDGVGAHDAARAGDRLEVRFRTDEVSREVLAVLFPRGRADAMDGTHGFGSAPGACLSSQARAMRLRPWRTRASSAWQIDLWRVAPLGSAQLSLRHDAPYRWTCAFAALPDLDRPDGELLMRVTAPAR